MMDASSQPVRARVAVPKVPASVILMGLFLGTLTGAALWALRPDVCADVCSVHAFLAFTIVLTMVVYVALGRQEGLPSAVSFALSFGFGLIVFALAISAARISAHGDDIMLEPMARAVLDHLRAV
jgi:hypothetical protein